jgi:dipeptidyl aminopeptidase/acylaminoacyl peptidase
VEFLFIERPALNKYKLREKSSFIIKSRDGLDLVCYLTRSIDFESVKPRKMVVLVHGGPWSRDRNDCDPVVQFLANRGYSVLQINYRGSLGFGNKFTNAAALNVRKIHEDIYDGVEWAIANKIADKKYIAIMGCSFGGYAALYGLNCFSETYCCGIDISGMSDLKTHLEQTQKYYASMLEMTYQFYGDPRTPEGREMLKKTSPINWSPEIAKPLLIVHGANDQMVKQQEAEQMVSILKSQKQPVAYILYPDEGHGIQQNPQNFKSLMAFIERFLANIMGGKCENTKLVGSSHQILEGKELLK